MVVVETRDLVKDYRMGFWRRKVRVLHGLNLEVRAGEIFGYLGPNGAGKTTTFKLLTGLLLPTSGRISILGRDVQDISIKADVGFLPENPYFYEYLTGREFLDFYGRLLGLGRSERRDRVGSLLQLVGLGGAAGLQLRKYSKGMLQRIGLAQALLNDPKLLILDEPMSGLDPIGRKEVRDLILKLKGEGRTILFSSHIVHDVEMVCDRVGIIVGGRLVRVGHLEELLPAEVESIEITASGLQDEAFLEVQGWSMRPPMRSGEKVLITIKDESTATEVLRSLLGKGCTIHSVSPQRRTLEEQFLQEVKDWKDEKSLGHRSEHL